MTGVGVVALPYDRDSVLRQLEAGARTPRPDTAPLESLFAAFRGPFTAYSAVTLRLGKLRRLRRRCQGRGPRLARASPTRSVRREARAERARAELDRARRDFVGRSDSLRRRMRQWEDSTYQGWDSVVQGLARRSGRAAVTDTTGIAGMGPLEARAGPLVGLRQELGCGGPERRVVLEHARDQGHAVSVEPHGAAAAPILGEVGCTASPAGALADARRGAAA